MAGAIESVAVDPRIGKTIPQVLARSAHEAPGSTYLVDGGSDYSFRDVANEVERVRRGLLGIGIDPGDRIVLWLPNGLAWIATFFAALELGATVVPAGTRLRTLDLRHILEDAAARALVYAPTFLGIDFDGMVGELAQLSEEGSLSRLEHLIATEETAVPSAAVLGSDAGDHTGTVAAPGVGDPAIACYTSGTTGRPKGCVHTHGALVRNAEVAADLTGLAVGERVVCPVPFAHVFGFHMGVLQAAAAGATLINAEPYAPDTYLDLCESHAATVAYAVPTMAREVLAAQRDSPRRLSIRVALVAGAPVSPTLRRGITAPDGIAAGLSIAYGCTEAPTISQLLPTDPPEEREDSVGRPTPGVDARIARPGTIDEVASGETGEILVRGYNTMVRYLGDRDASGGKFREGWLVTGDLGSLDRRGFLHFVSRADDTLLVGGFNAYPREIESQLEDLEGVEEVAVIGVPDRRLGQVPMAWVAADRARLEPGVVLAWAREHLASYKRPRYVEVVEELPRVGSGKIARARLREEARRALPDLPWRGAEA